MYIMEKENLTYPQRKRTPSFSSTLLDAIYRSIDGSKSDLDNHQQLDHHHHHHLNGEKSNRTTMKHNNHGGVGGGAGGGGNNKNKNKKEKMMNNHLCRRHSVMLDDECSQIFTNSVTSTFSSECSSYGGVGVGATFSSPKSEISSRHIQDHHHQKKKNQKKQQQKKAKRDGGGDNSKLRALKMYGKLKQPISPGSRIASFLCSIFNSGSVKKAKKMCYVGAVDDVNVVTFQHKSKSPCFSSSSSSSTMGVTSSLSRRSCMSKTSSSSSSSKAKNDNNNNGVKRSVRFYPVSVILGENDNDDSQHQHRYSAYSEKDPSLLPLNSVRKITRSSTSCIEAARENFSSGKGNNNGKFEYIRGYYGNCEDEDDEEDDALSYSSSDLFELDHIIGGAEGRYQEELPVYETTNLETNKAIANGLCL
ncbi:hypothetical protein PIB30_025485 [Stylosanthes scabra]|uniref:Protein BIG GRAIN 1-like B n=1 Tax=Stylosanthes scabra TaxID=79078 RepID=A0ABU6W9N4_9FABA|nr:hypothetical protein [Stylosanthes scabra]